MNSTTTTTTATTTTTTTTTCSNLEGVRRVNRLKQGRIKRWNLL